MGSVTRCYYCTDRAHFSSWPYQRKERAERSLLYLKNNGDIAGDECETMTLHHCLSLWHINILTRTVAVLCTTIIVALPLACSGRPGFRPQPTEGKHYFRQRFLTLLFSRFIRPVYFSSSASALKTLSEDSVAESGDTYQVWACSWLESARVGPAEPC